MSKTALLQHWTEQDVASDIQNASVEAPNYCTRFHKFVAHKETTYTNDPSEPLTLYQSNLNPENHLYEMTNLSDFCAQLVAKISITNVTLSFNNVTENVRVGQLWTWLCINDRKAARTITLQTCMQFYSIITVAGKGGANAPPFSSYNCLCTAWPKGFIC